MFTDQIRMAPSTKTLGILGRITGHTDVRLLGSGSFRFTAVTADAGLLTMNRIEKGLSVTPNYCDLFPSLHRRDTSASATATAGRRLINAGSQFLEGNLISVTTFTG